jgi:hypothetical protein
MSTRSPKPFLRSLASMTTLPRRGPGRDLDLLEVELLVLLGLGGHLLVAGQRLLLLVWRPLAFWRTHSSSSLSRFCSFWSFLPWTARRSAFFSR